MSDEQLCIKCKTLFREEQYDDEQGCFRHHETLESFQEALNLPCALCWRVQLALPRNKGKLAKFATDRYPFRMSYNVPVRMERSGSRDLYSLVFHTEKNRNWVGDAILVLEPWEQPGKQHQHYWAGNTNSDDSLSFLETKYKACLDTHAQCTALASSQNFRPTRLIDVGADEEDGLIRLCEGNTAKNYVALSHCWGGVQPLTLTQETETELRNGIVVSKLPKTFQDAVAVMRRLKQRHIWIDSLCILQDNKDDWDCEAGRMHDIYRHATFCIAATAAKDGSIGLFPEQDPRSLAPFKLDMFSSCPERHFRHLQGDKLEPPPPAGPYWIGSYWIWPAWPIDTAPLNVRAWVAQERHLSSRIMHFAKETVFWECHQGVVSESFPDEVPRMSRLVNTSRLFERAGIDPSLKLLLHQYRQNLSHLDPSVASGYIEVIRRAWLEFRNQYLTCKLTKEEDMFVALHGISQDVVTGTLNERVVAGLLESWLPGELCWITSRHDGIRDRNEPHRPAKWRAPSWSWASTTLPVTFSYKQNGGDDMVRVINTDIVSKQSGELIQASMRIECRLLDEEIRVVGADASNPQGFPDTAYHSLEDMGEEAFLFSRIVQIELDDPIPVNTNGEIRLVNFIIVQSYIDLFTKESSVRGIIVMSLDDKGEEEYQQRCIRSRRQSYNSQSERFQRIGVFDIDHSSSMKGQLDSRAMVKHFLDNHEQAQSRIIELV